MVLVKTKWNAIAPPSANSIPTYSPQPPLQDPKAYPEAAHHLHRCQCPLYVGRTQAIKLEEFTAQISKLAMANLTTTMLASFFAHLTCFQETKFKEVSRSHISTTCGCNFDEWHFVGSNGSAAGLLGCWDSSRIGGTHFQKGQCTLSTTHQMLRHQEKNWLLTNVYGPSNQTLMSNILPRVIRNKRQMERSKGAIW